MSLSSPTLALQATTYTSFNLDQQLALKSQHMDLFDSSKQPLYPISPPSPPVISKKGRKPGSTSKPHKLLSPGQLSGHWTNDQKKKYHWFMEYHHQHFENKHMRRMDKIFKAMADFIGSRAADQCRSHHQKMEKKYKSFYRIIGNLREQHYQSIEARDMRHEMAAYGMRGDFTLMSGKHIEKEYISEHEEEKEIIPKQAKRKIELKPLILQEASQQCHNKSYNIMEESLDIPLI